MAGVALVQSAKAASSSAVTSVTATTGATTTAGNLLVAIVSANNKNAVLSAPSGWSSVVAGQGNGLGAHLFWRSAAGGIQSFTFTADRTVSMSAVIAEFSGLASGFTAEAAAVAAVANGTSVTVNGSANPAQAGELVIAALGVVTLVAETVTTGTGYTKVDDTGTTAGASSELEWLQQTSESVTAITDTITYTPSTEALGFICSFAATRALTRGPADSPGVASDAFSRLITRPKTPSDALATITDAAGRLTAFTRSILAGPGAPADVVTGPGGHPATMADNQRVLLTETLVSGQGRFGNPSDTATGNDVATGTATQNRSAADSPGVAADSTVRQAAFTRALSGGPGAPTDTAAPILGRAITAQDSATGNDAVGRFVPLVRSAADAITTADSAGRTLVASRAPVEALTTADVASRLMTALKTPADTVSTVDGIARQTAMGRQPADSLSISDTPATRQLGLVRPLTEANATTDASVRALGRPETPADTLVIPTDTAARTKGANEAPAETVLGSDALDRQEQLVRKPADSTSSSDALARQDGLARAAADAALGSDIVGVPAAALVQSATGSGTTSAGFSFPTPTRAGNLLVAILMEEGSGTTGLFAPAGWTSVDQQVAATSQGQVVIAHTWYYENAPSTSSDVFSSPGASGVNLVVAEFSGVLQSGSLDQHGSASTAGGAQSGAVAYALPQYSHELIVAMFATGQQTPTSTEVPGGGFTAVNRSTSSLGAAYMDFLVTDGSPPTGQTDNAVFAPATSDGIIEMVMSFRAVTSLRINTVRGTTDNVTPPTDAAIRTQSIGRVPADTLVTQDVLGRPSGQLVQSATGTATGTTTETIFTSPTQAGSLLVAIVSIKGGTGSVDCTGVDNSGVDPTWHTVMVQTLPTNTAGVFNRVALLYREGAPAGITTLFFEATGADGVSAVVAEYSGIKSSGSLDVTNQGAGASGFQLSETASITPNPAELVVIGFGIGQENFNSTETAGAGFTHVNESNQGGAALTQAAMDYAVSGPGAPVQLQDAATFNPPANSPAFVAATFHTITTPALSSLRSAADSLSTTDAAVRAGGANRTAAEALSTLDAAGQVHGSVRNPQEVRPLIEVVDRQLSELRSTADSLTPPTDATVRSLAAIKAPAEALTTVDLASRAQGNTRTTSDVRPLIEVVTGQLAAQRAAVDVVPTAADQMDRVHGAVERPAEALTTLDQALRSQGNTRVTADVDLLTEAVQGKVNAPRTPADSLPAPADSLLAPKAAVEHPTEALSTVDLVHQQGGVLRKPTDLEHTTDSVQRSAPKFRGLNDVLQLIQDALAWVKAVTVGLPETTPTATDHLHALRQSHGDMVESLVTQEVVTRDAPKTRRVTDLLPKLRDDLEGRIPRAIRALITTLATLVTSVFTQEAPAVDVAVSTERIDGAVSVEVLLLQPAVSVDSATVTVAITSWDDAPVSAFTVGQLVRVTATFQQGGSTLNPDNVLFKLRPPASAIETFTYGIDMQVVRDRTGVFHFDVNLTKAGTWSYGWYSSGNGQGSVEGNLTVLDSVLA